MYMSLFFCLFICLFLMFAMIFLFGLNYNNNYLKLMMFECGFIPSMNSRNSFSLRFFLIVILFLIFDMEIILFVPVSLMKIYMSLTYMFFMVMFMILMLVFGLFYEWSQGVLSWI